MAGTNLLTTMEININIRVAIPVKGAEFARERNVHELDRAVDAIVRANVGAAGDFVGFGAPVVAEDPGVDFGRVVGESMTLQTTLVIRKRER